MACSLNIWKLIGLVLSCPAWNVMDWYFDAKATSEFWCLGDWYGPLAVANWFITPAFLLVTFYIFFDLDHTIAKQKWGLVGFGYFSLERCGGNMLTETLGIKIYKKWGTLRWVFLVVWLPFMVVINAVWLFIFNYLILWLASWHEWVMSLDAFSKDTGAKGLPFVSESNRQKFNSEERKTDGLGQNFDLLGKWVPIKRNRAPLWKAHAIPEKCIQIVMAFYCFANKTKTKHCIDDDMWQVVASGISGILMLLVTLYHFIRLYRAVYR